MSAGSKGCFRSHISIGSRKKVECHKHRKKKHFGCSFALKMTLNQIEVDGSSDCDQFVARVSICGVSIYKKDHSGVFKYKSQGFDCQEGGQFHWNESQLMIDKNICIGIHRRQCFPPKINQRFWSCFGLCLSTSLAILKCSDLSFSVSVWSHPCHSQCHSSFWSQLSSSFPSSE